MDISFIFFIAILIMSVVIHEVSHGYVADMLGDPTARLAGRLTLNPIHHLDPLGSFIVPVLMYFSTHGAFMLGWAKPVPYNPYNLKNQRWGTALVGVAGVLSNFLIAIIFGMLVRFGGAMSLPGAFIEISALIVLLNLVLAVFNLIPIPPLDGSKVLFSLLPYSLRGIQEFLEQYWYIMIIFVIFFAVNIVWPIVSALFLLITGMPFGI